MLVLLVASLFVSSVSSFQYTRTYSLNGRQYFERFEQPWFRVPHQPHEKIPIEIVANTSYNRHFIPPDDKYIAPYWTDIEKRTLPCLTRSCVCEYFGGDTRARANRNYCRLPSGEELPQAVRKELRILSEEEKKTLHEALNDLKRDGTYTRLARIHKYNGLHSGPAFLPFHREFLKRLEIVIRGRMKSPHSLGVPYWDSSLDSLLPDPSVVDVEMSGGKGPLQHSIIWSPLFLGTTDGQGVVVTGPYANWTTMDGERGITRLFGADPRGELLTHGRIDWNTARTEATHVLAATLPLSTCTTHNPDDRMIEYSHDYVHYFIDGDMAGSWSSANDPVFLYHHSMIDFMFELFRQHSQNRTAREREYPEDDPSCFPPKHFAHAPMPFLPPMRIIDGLSNSYTDNMYEYSPRPTCTLAEANCGSEYLFCDISHFERPICMSKVRLGGNCAGFEGSRICHGGECREGRCTRDPLHLQYSKPPFVRKPELKQAKTPWNM